LISIFNSRTLSTTKLLIIVNIPYQSSRSFREIVIKKCISKFHVLLYWRHAFYHICCPI